MIRLAIAASLTLACAVSFVVHKDVPSLLLAVLTPVGFAVSLSEIEARDATGRA